MLRVLIIEDTPDRLKALKGLYRAHAWIHTAVAHHAVRLVRHYKFDIIALDYNLNGPLTGADVAAALPGSLNDKTKVIVHSLNPRGARRIHELLPGAVIYPVSRMTRNNRHFKYLRSKLDELGPDFEWETDAQD